MIRINTFYDNEHAGLFLKQFIGAYQRKLFSFLFQLRIVNKACNNLQPRFQSKPIYRRLTTYFSVHHTYSTNDGSKNTDPTVLPMQVPFRTYIFDVSNQTGASLQCKMKEILDEQFARFRQRVKPPEISTL